MDKLFTFIGEKKDDLHNRHGGLKNALHSGSGGRLGADPRRDQASGR
jgi:hypothetical protein